MKSQVEQSKEEIIGGFKFSEWVNFLKLVGSTIIVSKLTKDLVKSKTEKLNMISILYNRWKKHTLGTDTYSDLYLKQEKDLQKNEQLFLYAESIRKHETKIKIFEKRFCFLEKEKKILQNSICCYLDKISNLNDSAFKFQLKNIKINKKNDLLKKTLMEVMAEKEMVRMRGVMEKKRMEKKIEVVRSECKEEMNRCMGELTKNNEISIINLEKEHENEMTIANGMFCEEKKKLNEIIKNLNLKLENECREKDALKNEKKNLEIKLEKQNLEFIEKSNEFNDDVKELGEKLCEKENENENLRKENKKMNIKCNGLQKELEQEKLKFDLEIQKNKRKSEEIEGYKKNVENLEKQIRGETEIIDNQTQLIRLKDCRIDKLEKDLIC